MNDEPAVQSSKAVSFPRNMNDELGKKWQLKIQKDGRRKKREDSAGRRLPVSNFEIFPSSG